MIGIFFAVFFAVLGALAVFHFRSEIIDLAPLLFKGLLGLAIIGILGVLAYDRPKDMTPWLSAAFLVAVFFYFVRRMNKWIDARDARRANEIPE